MIPSSFDTRDLGARLDRMPALLRTALAHELAALAQRLHATASIDTTADTVTATIRTADAPPAARAPARNRINYRKGRYGHAKDAMAFRPPQRLRALRVPSASFALTDFPSASIEDIRAALEAAARAAFSE